MVSMNPRQQQNQKPDRSSASMLVQSTPHGSSTMSSSVGISTTTNNPNDWVIGCTIKLLTTLEEEISGTIFAYDKLSNCVTLIEESDNKKLMNFRILKTTFIKKIISAEAPKSPPNLHLPYVDLRAEIKEEMDRITETKIAAAGGLPTAPARR